jgi:hypothetical protein
MNPEDSAALPLDSLTINALHYYPLQEHMRTLL